MFEIDEILGLPAHPLLVHAVVVLVPLASVGLVLSIVAPRLRTALLVPSVVIAGIALVVVPFAQGSGEDLQDRVRETPEVEDHAGEGDRALPAAGALFASSVALLVVDRRQASRRALLIAGVIVVGASLVATTVTAMLGHSGAEAVWHDVDENEGPSN